MSTIAKRQEQLQQQIEEALKASVAEAPALYRVLTDAIQYSLLDGGKRIRPLLLLEFCTLCGGNPATAMPFACALEMIHTYSLIHDDLPCMDDDDMRRGRPSNHKVFGEDMALLAGDALQALAYEQMLSPTVQANVGNEKACKASYLLAQASGYHGMVGGQVIDLQSEGKQVSLEVLQEMDKRKTGALIVAACEMGCVLGGATQAQQSAAKIFGAKIGLAFQIIDDILDVTSSTEELGKQVGSDASNQKSTYVSQLGLEKAQETADQLTKEAIDSLAIFLDSQVREDLIALAKYLTVRKK